MVIPKIPLNTILFVSQGQGLTKPRTDVYVFIFGGREFQTDDPENAKLILYRSMRVRGKTYFLDSYRAGALLRRSHTY